MPVQKLKEFLDRENIKYVNVTHSQAFTAQQVAASAHIPGKDFAKTVMIKVDGEMAMAVLPASYRVDLQLLQEAVGANNLQLATESEFKDRFPGCEIGAMPPFGNLYDMETYVAESLAEDEEFAFNAGTHTELIKMSFADFERLVEPKILAFSIRQL